MKYVWLLIFFAFSFIANVQAQKYILPNDPVRFNNISDHNWLKKSMEEGLNDQHFNDHLTRYVYYFWDYKDAISELGRNEKYFQIVFNWAKPYIKSKIASLNIIESIKLFNALSHSKSYLENLDCSYEQRYLTANKSLFSYQDPRSFFDRSWNCPYPYTIANNDYRDLETFLFRRINNGCSKEMIIKYINEILQFIHINFSKKITINDVNGNKTHEFFWNKNQFEGNYSEFRNSTVFGSEQTYLSITGNYIKGKKDGIWKYFSISNNEVLLNNEIEYRNGNPIKLIEYDKTEIRNANIEINLYELVSKLDILQKTLEVTVYYKNNIILTVNSLDDNIDYWDLYDTKRRIVAKLSKPNLEIETNKNITIDDKPIVKRDNKTNNYIIYDQLKRKDKDHALLIATESYNNENFEKLKNPIRDADAIANDLANIYGFDCEIIRNPTKDIFLSCLEKYKKKKFESDEQLFIFISGHGSYDAGRKEGYLIPKDGKSTNDDFLHNTWISYEELLKNIKEIKFDHILLAVDACYSGSFQIAAAKFKSDSDEDFGTKLNDPKRWFLNRIRFKTKMYITSTAEDRLSSDGINHSPFASRFIKGLRTFGDDSHILTISEVYAFIDGIDPPPIKDYFGDNEPQGSFFFIMK